MRSRVSLVALVSLVLLSPCLSGCIWSRARVNDPKIVERAKLIRPGVTREADLPALLAGQPTRRRLEDGKTVYEYSYSDAKTETFSIIILSFSRTEDVSETLYVEVDPKTGLVTRVPKLTAHEPEWRCWPFGDDEEK